MHTITQHLMDIRKTVLLMALVLCTAMFSSLWVSAAYAQPAPPVPAPGPGAEPSPDGCTSSPAYNIPTGGQGILSQVAQQVKSILNSAAEALFTSITTNRNFIKAAYAAVTLFIAIYGAMFLIGMVNLTLGEGIVRLVKIGIVFALFTEGWAFFSEYVVRFFDQGTDELINMMVSISVGGAPGGSTDTPLRLLDGVMRTIFSIKFFITLVGSTFTGPYGVLFAGLLMFSVGTFLKAVLQALWVYLMAAIARTLLFGLAPIFLTCLLFSRTKHLFDGWLSQLVNYSLQPIFLFAFLGFYVVLIQSSIENILKVQWCWSNMESVLGSTFEINFWRAAVNGAAADKVDWGWTGAIGVDNTKAFPIDIVDVLIFLLLTQLAWRYTQVVVTIAREISGSTIFLTNLQGALAGWFSGMQARGGEAGRAFVHGHVTSTGQRGVGGLQAVRATLKGGGG